MLHFEIYSHLFLQSRTFMCNLFFSGSDSKLVVLVGKTFTSVNAFLNLFLYILLLDMLSHKTRPLCWSTSSFFLKYPMSNMSIGI